MQNLTNKTQNGAHPKKTGGCLRRGEGWNG